MPMEGERERGCGGHNSSAQSHTGLRRGEEMCDSLPCFMAAVRVEKGERSCSLQRRESVWRPWPATHEGPHFVTISVLSWLGFLNLFASMLTVESKKRGVRNCRGKKKG